MDGRYGLYRQNSGLWRSLRDGDFEEDDVWDVLKERTSLSSFKLCASMEPPPSPSPSSSSSSSPSSSSGSMPLLSVGKMIPRPSFNGRNNQGQNLQKSAPVNIPQWPENYSKKYYKTPRDDDNDGDSDGEEEEEEEEEDDDQLPPHEYIARRLATSHISSFSVLEGIGRTLKGRDLSKVRNAILTKTGFLE